MPSTTESTASSPHALKENGIGGLGVENHSESIAAGEKFGVEYLKIDIFQFLRREDLREIARQCDGSALGVVGSMGPVGHAAVSWR